MTTTAPEIDRTIAARSYGSGVGLALFSASSFGLSGSLARSLLDLGWSPAAVVATRVGGAFLILLIPSLLLLRRIGLPTGRQAGRMLAFGAVAIALAQLCYFSAVQYLSVGVALLLEFLAPVMLIGWHWARTHRRPAWPVLAGAGLSVAGLAFVLDLRGGLTLNPIGVAWGLGAALCLSVYFLLSEDSGTGAPIHPLLLTTAGTGIGAGVLLAASAAGILPLAAHTGVTILADGAVGWWLPALLLILVSAVLAYPSGIVAVRRLGSSLASFVALTEVIFAVVFAFLLLGQRPGPVQLVGGVLILVGIALVQRPVKPKTPLQHQQPSLRVDN
ncbi:MAG TPA: EamA family transporter [Propionibacteriaceae bacterium]|nr:EamA family transporter [Propionibacteriaceae bacterium]